MKKTKWTPTKIRGLRADAGATQQEFATMLGLAVRTIQGWESGANIPSPMAAKALDALADIRDRARGVK
jgi:DNA-binding transcriptional regulator YiaG